MEIKIKRAGAYWVDDDGSRYAWDDDGEFFQNVDTGEAYDVIIKLNDEEAYIG